MEIGSCFCCLEGYNFSHVPAHQPVLLCFKRCLPSFFLFKIKLRYALLVETDGITY